MNLEIITLSEVFVSQTQRDKDLTVIACRRNLLKNYTNELIYKTEIDPQAQRVKLPSPEGKEAGEGIKQEVGISRHKPLHTKYITHRDLRYITGNSTWHLVRTCNCKESEYTCIYIHIYPFSDSEKNLNIYIYTSFFRFFSFQRCESLCFTPAINTTLYINSSSITEKHGIAILFSAEGRQPQPLAREFCFFFFLIFSLSSPSSMIFQ